MGRVVFGVALAMAGGSLRAEPTPVSPGAADGLTLVLTACPTFDFAAVAGPTTGYQLAIYDLGAGGAEDPESVNQVDLPAGANGWTPSADQCLELGRRYAWAVRAVGADGPGTWSEIFYFRTPESAFTASQLEEVTARVREELESAAAQGVIGPSASRQLLQGTASGDGGAPDLATVKAGLRATPSETTGEIAGVVGVSQSPDGAGLIAANTNPGGADLVLEGQSHGAEDTIVTESGIEVGGTSFSISGQPGLTVLIDGSEAVTSETISQHDTLGMLNCAENQVAQWNGSEWVCKTLMLGDIVIPVPDAPLYVRVVPNYLDPSTKRLAWSMADLTGIANFIVYQLPSPITEANKHLATRRVANDLWVPITVIPDSGLMHFRVEAVNIQAAASPLSREYRLNTALRIQFRAVDLETFESTSYLATPNGVLTPIEVWPNWSPGGDRFTFVEDDVLYVSELGGVPIAVSAPLAPGESFGFVTWSPDNLHFAYTVRNDGEVQAAFLGDATGGPPKEIPGFEQWSPAGAGLAFFESDESGLTTLNVYDLATQVSAQLDIEVDAFFRPRWSPDGLRIAYARQRSLTSSDFWVAHLSGDEPINLSASLETVVLGSGASWSPDGLRVAFLEVKPSASTPGIYERSLYVGAVTEQEPTRVYGPPEGNVSPLVASFVSPVQWSPDGGSILFAAGSDSGHGLFLVPATGGSPSQLSDPPHEEGGFIGHFEWSDSGAWVAFGGALKWDDTGELFVWRRESGSTSRPHGPSQKGVGFGTGGDRMLAPSSTHVAYLFQQRDGHIDLFSTGLNGGKPVKLNPDGSVVPAPFSGFDWVPQGWVNR